MAVGVIDVGSNTIKMLLATLNEENQFQVIDEKTLEIRISEGITLLNSHLTDSAIQKGAHAVAFLQAQAMAFGIQNVSVVATSAVREADNGASFCDAVREMTGGLDCRILSGTEEAAYIAHGVNLDPTLKGTSDRLIMDLGGGSLELIRMVEDEVHMKSSLPIGAVRMMNQFISYPERALDSSEIQLLDDFIKAQLAEIFLSNEDDSLVVVGTGGAVTHLRMALACERGCALSDMDAFIPMNTIERMYATLASLDASDRLKWGIPKSRVDIMPPALRIILHVLRQVHAKGLNHSFYNLRYGYAHEILSQM